MMARCKWRSGSSMSSVVPGSTVSTVAAMMTALRSPSDILSIPKVRLEPLHATIFDVVRVVQRDTERAQRQKVVQPLERGGGVGGLLGTHDFAVLYIFRNRAGPLILGGHEVEEDGRMGLRSRAVYPEGVLGGLVTAPVLFEPTPALGGKCEAARVQPRLAVREDASDFALAGGRGEMLQESRFAGAVGPDDEDLLAGFEFDR